MKSIVIYASHSGNTRQIAEVIAAELESRGPVHLLIADEASTPVLDGTDLLVIGSPTEGHGMIAPVAHLVDRLTPAALRGLAVATFDTRLRWPRWLAGSAGNDLAHRLRDAGARVVIPAESYFVTFFAKMEPLLAPGEIERAGTWAATLSTAVEQGRPAITSDTR